MTLMEQETRESAQAVARCLARGRYLGQDARAAVAAGPNRAACPRAGREHGVDEDRVDFRWQVLGRERAPGRDADAEPAPAVLAHAVNRGTSGRAVRAQVEDAEVAGPLDGNDKVGVGLMKGRYADDEVTVTAFRRHASLR